MTFIKGTNIDEAIIGKNTAENAEITPFTNSTSGTNTDENADTNSDETFNEEICMENNTEKEQERCNRYFDSQRPQYFMDHELMNGLSEDECMPIGGHFFPTEKEEKEGNHSHH